MNRNFPELSGKITGANYPPPPLAQLALKALGYLQIAGIVCIFLGRNLFHLFGFRVPAWYSTFEKYGFQIAIFVFLLVPNMLSKYLITGAFEIILVSSHLFCFVRHSNLLGCCCFVFVFGDFSFSQFNAIHTCTYFRMERKSFLANWKLVVYQMLVIWRCH